MNAQKTHWYDSPFAVEGFSVGQYVLKASLKISVGTLIVSPMIAADGVHNLADIVQALVIMFGIWLTRREWKQYPFGLKNAESIVSVVIGALLVYAAINFGVHSLLGLFGGSPGSAKTLSRDWLIPLVLLTGLSVLLSLLTSHLQIRVGKKTGEYSIVADGKETRADAVIEGLSCLGILLNFAFSTRLPEHVVGLLIAGFVGHTAWEILKPGLDSLLKKSLGEDLEQLVQTRTMSVPGVLRIQSLQTFRVGRGQAVCILTVATALGSACYAAIQLGIDARVKSALIGKDDIKEVQLILTTVRPKAIPRRIAYACVRLVCGGWRVVGNLIQATHLIVCDMTSDDVIDWSIHTREIKGSPYTAVRHHHVDDVYVYTCSSRSLDLQLGPDLSILYAEDPNPEVCLGVQFSEGGI